MCSGETMTENTAKAGSRHIFAVFFGFVVLLVAAATQYYICNKLVGLLKYSLNLGDVHTISVVYMSGYVLFIAMIFDGVYGYSKRRLGIDLSSVYLACLMFFSLVMVLDIVVSSSGPVKRGLHEAMQFLEAVVFPFLIRHSLDVPVMVALVMVVLFAAYLLFLFRSRERVLYGSLEMLFGSLSIMIVSLGPVLEIVRAPGRSLQGGAWGQILIQLFGSTYIVVRGMVNISDDKGGAVPSPWGFFLLIKGSFLDFLKSVFAKVGLLRRP
jgi:hypothetical protein